MRHLQVFMTRTAVLLLLLLGFARGLTAQSGPVELRGDVSRDGRIAADDALLVLSGVVGKSLPSGVTLLPGGDANADGFVSAADALVILSYAVGRIVGQPYVGQPIQRSIQVSPAEPTLTALGASLALSGTALDAADSATSCPIRWRSLSPEVATVDSVGRLAAVDVGTAPIVAACGDVADTVLANVSQRVASVTVSSTSLSLTVGDTARLTVIARDSLGSVVKGGSGQGAVPVEVTWSSSDITVATVDGAGVVKAVGPGRSVITAKCDGVSVTTQVAVAAKDEAAPGGGSSGSLDQSSIVNGRQWSISDDGHFVSADGPTLRLKFAYNAQGWQGWFKGGGGHDGTIAELYYKPTSTTRNLAFRNGAWGGELDGLDYFQAEGASVDQMDHNTADFASGTHGRVVSHRVWESAGRLFAEFELDFEAWHITRTYVVYPWGDITMHARITQVTAGRWSYFGRRIHFAVSHYRVANGATTYDWGGNYESDGEHFYAWSDGYGDNGKAAGTGYYRYDEVIRKDLNRNTSISQFGRGDHYSGFMIDDRNQNDPDIVVMNGDPSEYESPFGRISRAVGGKEYIETGIFSPAWANHTTHAGVNWFYNTIRCCPAEYSNPMYWPVSLGTWEESFHVLFRQNIEPDDYLALWQERARDVQRSQPYDVSDAVARFDPVDRVYHLRANPGSTAVRFRWQRLEAAARALDYRTVFVVEGLPNARTVSIDGVSPPGVAAYHDASGDIMVVLVGDQPAVPQPLEITVQ